MKRKSKPSQGELSMQPFLDFEEVIKQAHVRSRDELLTSCEYDPVASTAGYMQRAVEFEEKWETTIQKARKELMRIDARELYDGFITDLIKQIGTDTRRSARLAHLLNLVAVRGFGMSQQQIKMEKPAKGATRWKVSHLNFLSHFWGSLQAALSIGQ